MAETKKTTSRGRRTRATAKKQAKKNAAASSSALKGEGDDLRQLMATNFIEYASYVIKERAIPHVHDGLKPVQRRILHSLHQMDDGRYHKVANVIGHCMQYHPHGDASIGSALVVLANKDYFIDKQGNFGNPVTGDRASAARYIECRLTPLAREVLFNPEITEFIDSYDGRNKEPVTLPAKVPALLMQGSDGIAVGMSTTIFPHNFCELLEAQISILKEEEFELYPDFLHGGTMDVGEYDDGRGKIRLRAKIDVENDKTIIIREVPGTVTTETLVGSIEEAARKGKIKISSINDYTAEDVEIEIKLPRGVHAKPTVLQLYAYTKCEISPKSNIVVIHDNRPEQMAVSEILRLNTERLVENLKRELELELEKLRGRFHAKTLARIFIENRIYKRIEESETYELVKGEVLSGLNEYRDQLQRDITDDDIEKLLQIPIRRISRFDINKNREELENIEAAIRQTRRHLKQITEYTVNYIQELLDKYGESYPRRTEITDMREVNARKVARKSLKVGHDRVRQFVGSEVRNSNKGDSYLACSEFDKLVLIRNDGVCKVIPVPEKLYVGPTKFVLKSDKEQVYHIIYRDRKRGVHYAKRFKLDSFILEREYNIVPENCIIETLYTNYGVVIRCQLKPNKRLAQQYVDVEFDKLPMRSRDARGFKVTHHPVDSLIQLKRGTAEPTPEEERPETGPVSTHNRDSEEDQSESKASGDEAARDENSESDAGEQEGTGKKRSSEQVRQSGETAGKESGTGEDSKEGKKETEGARKGGPKDRSRKRKGKKKTKSSKKTKKKTKSSKSKKRSGGGKKSVAKKKDASDDSSVKSAEQAGSGGGDSKRTAAPTGRSESNGGRTDGQDEKAESAKGARSGPRKKLIDEETPFFLE